MPKLSTQTKEIINIILFFLVVGLLLTFYMIYPLNRSKAMFGRVNLDEYEGDSDSLILNEAEAYIQAGLKPDTFRVETDGLTTLACLACVPEDSVIGTVILLHNDQQDRDSVISIAGAFVKRGYGVIACDQRGSGRSTGEYRGEGWYEANDLAEVIVYLNLRNQLVHPVTAIGFGVGADAVIMSSRQEKRIDAVVAVDPYLSTTRWLDILKERNEAIWFPFYRTTIWWWYNMRSSYAADYRRLEQIRAVGAPSLVFIAEQNMGDEEVARIKELSSPELLRIEPTPPSDSLCLEMILDYVTNLPKDTTASGN